MKANVKSLPRTLRGRQVGNFLVEALEQPAQQPVGNTFDMRFILACTPKLAQMLEVPVEQLFESAYAPAGSWINALS